MKQKNALVPAVAIALGLLTATLGLFSRRMAPQPPADENTAPPAAAYQYLLQTTAAAQSMPAEECLELYQLEQGSWAKVADFDLLEDLPAADRQLLRRGMVLRNAAELQRALEDYLPNS